MRALVTLRLAFALFLLLAGSVFTAGPSEAQVDPLWDHYKVYEANPKPQLNTSVFLRDQFTQGPHVVQFLDRYMNPVEKFHNATGQNYPINDPLLHYTWWKINPAPFDATVAYNNQFGGGSVHVFNAQYLLNPSLKNQTGGPLPLENHYKCYDCEGPPISMPLRLTDQFDVWQINQLFPRYFCTPTEKEIPGAIYPVVDPDQHYVCYEFQPPDNQLFSAVIRDQFIQTTVELRPGHLLCVPTDKHEVTKSAADTWGRLKLLYR